MAHNPFPWRRPLDGQVSRLRVYDVTTGTNQVVYETALGIAEAPNWTIDGDWLVFNQDGRLYRVPVVGGGEAVEIQCGLELANNDHVLDP
ncbi:MAG: hypothetical protein LBH76_10525, partial [Propionibacteriaceae bacterium]|nr:hypothetical protein [Propionibacteriaceae bacterium]